MWKVRPTKAHVYQAMSDAVNVHVQDGSSYRIPEVLAKKLVSAAHPCVYGHLPYNLFMTRIVEQCGPSCCVELGTHNGVGARHLAAGDEDTQVWTVDFDPHGVGFFKGWPNIRFVQALAVEAADLVPSPIDLLFIDTEQTYDSVMREFYAYKPKLGDPSLVLFDDAYHNEDVAPAWAELGLDGFVSPCLHYTGFGIAFVGQWRDGEPRVVSSLNEYGAVMRNYDAKRKELGFHAREDD